MGMSDSFRNPTSVYHVGHIVRRYNGLQLNIEGLGVMCNCLGETVREMDRTWLAI